MSDGDEISSNEMLDRGPIFRQCVAGCAERSA